MLTPQCCAMLCVRGIDPSSPEQMWMVTALWSQLRCRHSKWALQILLRHPKLDISWPKSTTKYYTKYRMGLILMLLQLWNFPPPRSWKCFQARAVLVKSNLPQEQHTNHIQLCLSNLVMQNVIWSFTAVENRVSETGWAGADLYPGRCGQGALSLARFLGLLLACSQLLIQALRTDSAHQRSGAFSQTSGEWFTLNIIWIDLIHWEKSSWGWPAERGRISLRPAPCVQEE